MTTIDKANLGSYLHRNGIDIAISKVPDRFTARIERGRQTDQLVSSQNITHTRSLNRQRLDEFAVDSANMDQVMAQLRQDEEVAFTSHVYCLDKDPQARLYLTDEITLQFQEDISDRLIEELADEHGLIFIKSIFPLNNCYAFRLGQQAKENPVKLSNRLREMEMVKACEANVAVPSEHYFTPSDQQFKNQWHLFHNGGFDLSTGSHVDAPRAWDISQGERTVVVAVTDDSVDLKHRDFQGEGKIVAPRDFKGRDFDPLPEAASDNHGTAAAGVAIAEANGYGVVGIAPGCALMPVRTSGFLDDNTIEELFGWCTERGASVISCSWGSSAYNYPLSMRQSQALKRAATEGRNGKGCVIVFASGNANRPINDTVNEREWPSSSKNGPTLWHDGFSTHEDVIAVSACTSRNEKSAYSNWGKEISVCAPSNNGHPSTGRSRTYPLISSSFRGRGIVTTDRVGASGYDSSDYAFDFGGTSSACPLVAGIAALILSVNPDLSSREVREVLESSTDKITDPQTDPQLGNAFGNYDENGHSLWFGYGKVNAFKAVKEALKRKTASGGGNELTKTSKPQVAIPDNNTTGITDTIQITAKGALKDIEVTVDITHTYRGDLKVSLIPPSGETIVLHNRNGGGADNLTTTYTLATTPALSQLVGKSLKGTWTIQVQDAAAQDTGTFNSWGLKLSTQSNNNISISESPGLPIPDNDPSGMQRTLNVINSGKLSKIEVSVDISHTYIEDLRLILRSPQGSSVTLHDNTGGRADNIIKTYSSATHAGLQKLIGESVQGAWVLQVSDRAAQDVGKLNKWGLEMGV